MSISFEDVDTTLEMEPFEIPQGAHFHLEFPQFVDPETGDPYDFTHDPDGDWSARMDVRTSAGDLVVAFSSRGGTDGTITLDTQGGVSLDLDSDHTAELSPTYDLSNVATGLSLLYAQLVLTEPDGERWRWFQGKCRVSKEITPS